MPFRTAENHTPHAEVFRRGNEAVENLRRTLAQFVNVAETNDVSARSVLGLLSHLRRARVALVKMDIPGIVQYARDQFEDQAYDVRAEGVALVVQIDATAQWIIDNVPNSGGANDYLLIEQIDLSDWSASVRRFTPAQTASLRVALNSLLSAID